MENVYKARILVVGGILACLVGLFLIASNGNFILSKKGYGEVTKLEFSGFNKSGSCVARKGQQDCVRKTGFIF